MSVQVRQSLASQLEDGLNRLVESGAVESWTLTDGTSYCVFLASGYIEPDLSPGECMEFVNHVGSLDVYIGKP